MTCEDHYIINAQKDSTAQAMNNNTYLVTMSTVRHLYNLVRSDKWESNPNRLPSRHISVDKHEALNKTIDDLLDLQVIQPSKTTSFSQVHLVWKPSCGWRFTVDYLWVEQGHFE